MASTALAITGIILVLIGTALMAFSAIRVPSLLMDPWFQSGREHVIQVGKDSREKGWDAASVKVKEDAYARAEQQYREDRAGLADEIAQAWRNDRSRVVNLNLWGLGFVLLGSACQGIATVLLAIAP